MIRTLALLLSLLLAPFAAHAQTPPPDLEKILQLLQDDAQRQAFATQLQGLIEAAKRTAPPAPEPPTPVGVLGSGLAALTDSLGAISAGLGEATTAVSNAPVIIAWIEAQVRDPAALARWFQLIWKLAATLLAGWIAGRFVRWALAPTQHRLAGIVPSTWWVRLALVLGRLCLGVLAILGFAAGAYLTLTVVEPSATVRLVTLALINGALIVQGVVLVIEAVLQPRAAPLRLVPLEDDTAAYLYVWLRRLAAIAIYGTFAIEAAQLLGLGLGAFVVLQRLLGLTLVTMIAILILQNRTPVARWIRGRTAWPDGHTPPRLRGLAHRLADYWHVLALGYVLALFFIWAVGIPGGFAYLLRVTVLTVMILTAVTYAGRLIDWVIKRGFSVGTDLSARLPDLQTRADRYLPLLNTVLRSTLWLIAGIFLLQVWGVNSFGWLASAAGRSVVGSIVTIAGVLGIAFGIWEVISATFERMLRDATGGADAAARTARTRTLLPLIRNALMVVLVAMTGLIVLSELGVNIAPLLAGAGVIGLAIGFGAQTLVRDVITGLFILFEDTIRVGDIVQVAGKSGAVEAINIRGITLRDAAGAVISIPFGSVGEVTNMTRDYSYASFDIPIEIGRDVSTAKSTLAAIDAAMRADPTISTWLLGPFEVLGIERFEGGLFFLRARIKTQAGKQWAIVREVNLRLQAGFIDKGVWVPAVAPTGALPSA